MSWRFRRNFWQVGVVRDDGRRVLLFHKRRQSQAQGLILLGLVSEMTWEEISAWLNLDPEESTAAAGVLGRRPQ
jgi:hypothetical protein